MNLLFAAEKLLLLTDVRPPFQFLTKSGEVDGVSVVVVKRALNKMNWPYEIKIRPWNRAQSEVKRGNADGFFSASQNTDRDFYATLSGIVVDQYWSWYVLKSYDLEVNSVDFKKNAKVGSWFGSNSLKWLLDSGFNVKGVPVTTNTLALMLNAGHLDAIFGSNIAIQASFKKAGFLDYIREIKAQKKPMGVYFSKEYLSKHPFFLAKFNRMIKELQ
jgi:ABC-type amino acid transport substrate-binding protein